jgi:N6-L-threonylcarbamoyladenine synthase
MEQAGGVSPPTDRAGSFNHVLNPCLFEIKYYLEVYMEYPACLLGIDTSCDDTSVAVVAEGREIRSNVVTSQIDRHREFGGVVPEIASRQHLCALEPAITEALRQAGLTRREVQGFAVTWTPGMIGALVVGISAAKAMAWATGRPLLAVNHLEAHVYALQLEQTPPPYPHVCLLVSGGHTLLLEVGGPLDVRPLGTTLDDAAGEAFDKVAKLFGLGYPGGPVIARLAEQGDSRRYALPRPMLHSGNLDFSFSGLKTAARRLLEQEGREAIDANDLAASLQEAIVDVLSAKAMQAMKRTGLRRLALAGGVAANERLRVLCRERAAAAGVEVFVPSRALCTDNAAMVAGLAWHLFRQGRHADFSLNGRSSAYLAGDDFAWSMVSSQAGNS